SGRQCALLTDERTRVALQTPGCPDFVMPNAGGAGYYRFDPGDDGWRALTAHLDRLDEAEALAVADSLSAAYQANRLSTAAFLEAVGLLAQSGYPQVAMASDGDLVRLRDHLVPAGARAAVTAFMRATYRPRLDELGPEDAVATDAGRVQRELFRANLVRFLALDADDAGIRETLAGQARRYIGFGAPDAKPDPAAVQPALVEVALQVGVQEHGLAFTDALIERMLASGDIQFRSQAALALGATDDPEVGERVRRLLLDPALRMREPTTIAFALAARPSQRRATFDWFRANHEAFIGRTSPFGYRWLPRFGAGFCTLPERDEVRALFTPLLGRLPGAERTLA